MINPVYQNHQTSTTYKAVSQSQENFDIAESTKDANAVVHTRSIGFSTIHNTFTAQRDEFLEMIAEIENFFKDFHSGNGSLGGMQALFNKSFATLQRLNAEAGVTSESWGNNYASLENSILSHLLGAFASANREAATDAMIKEGQRIADLHGVSGEACKDWGFFDARFYFKAAGAQNAILDLTRQIASGFGEDFPYPFGVSLLGSMIRNVNFPAGSAPSHDYSIFQAVGGKEITTGTLIGVNHPLHLKAEKEANELFGDDIGGLREHFFRRLYALINDEWFTTLVSAGLPSESAKAILEETEREPDINLRRELIMQRIRQNHDELVAGMIDIGLPKDWRQTTANSAYGSNFQYQTQ